MRRLLATPLGGRVLRLARSPGLVAVADQGLVSGFGFLTGIVVARMVDLPSFGRFALVMIFMSSAQSLHNAMVVSPMMTLIGSRLRPSRAYNASILGAAALASVAAGLLIAALLAGFFAFRGEWLSPRFLASIVFMTVAQNFTFTLRRLLFACGRGLMATLMDGLRAASFPLALLVLRLMAVPVSVTLLLEVLGVTALVTAVPFLPAFRPPRRGALRMRAVVRRHVPLARWLMPVVLVTFGQEQLVWILAGMLLGDHAVGGLRAAQYLVGLILLLLTATENVIPVGASRAFAADGKPGLLRYLLSTGLGLGLLIAVPVLLVIGPAETWLRVVFGEAYAPFAGCLRILATATLLVHVRDMAAQYFRATQRTGIIFQAFAASLVVSLLSLYPLLNGFGLIGAALVIFIGHATSMCFMLLAAFLDLRKDLGRLVLEGGPLWQPNRR